MPRWCMHVRMPGGAIAIVCGSGPKPDPPFCHWCDKPTEFCCDQPVGDHDCNAPMCADHRQRIGNKDFCPWHAKQGQLFKEANANG